MTYFSGHMHFNKIKSATLMLLIFRSTQAITSKDELLVIILVLFSLFFTIGLQKKRDENSVHLSLCSGDTVADGRG